jgi:hypothetical protein
MVADYKRLQNLYYYLLTTSLSPCYAPLSLRSSFALTLTPLSAHRLFVSAYSTILKQICFFILGDLVNHGASVHKTFPPESKGFFLLDTFLCEFTPPQSIGECLVSETLSLSASRLANPTVHD